MHIVFAVNFLSGTVTAILVFLMKKSYKEEDKTFRGARERRNIIKWLPPVLAIYIITNIVLLASK
jgi:uncharacterized membrane protein YdcZ (DUF606 family)